MESDNLVWKCRLFMSPLGHDRPFYTQTAERTGIVVDGVEMVRLHTAMFPIDGWHATKEDAEREIRDELISFVSKIQSFIDSMPSRSEVTA
jgi:hypothetical protein